MATRVRARSRPSPAASSTASAPVQSSPSGRTQPLWYAGASQPRFGPLRRSLRADVVVVGAGIAGLTTAYLLAKEGKRVVVLDEKPVGGGETGRTSAHLASAIDNRFATIERVHGAAAMRLHYESHAAAIDLIEEIDREEALGSGFARVDGFLFLGKDQGRGKLETELQSARRANVTDVELLREVPGLTLGPCIRFPQQAVFHPLMHVFGLARVLKKMGVGIYCGQRVMDLAGDGPVKAKLGGVTVSALAGVAATNVPTPINNWMGIYLKQAAYRTYVVGLAIRPGAIPDALYWDFEDPYHYVRLHRARDGRTAVLVVGGEDHKTGQGGNDEEQEARFGKLAEWARQRFPGAGREVSRWSGQVNEPGDGVAFIGRVPSTGHKACYVITGDSGMGLTHGTLGARLVTDLILGRRNQWERLYSPGRRPTRSLSQFVKENANAAVQFTDYLTGSEVGSEKDIARDCGAVMRDGLTKVAVYRDAAGRLHRKSAVCPHLGCIVHWNDVEKSWDCPCHGSRFTPLGGLITGPAIDDLPKA